MPWNPCLMCALSVGTKFAAKSYWLEAGYPQLAALLLSSVISFGCGVTQFFVTIAVLLGPYALLICIAWKILDIICRNLPLAWTVHKNAQPWPQPSGAPTSAIALPLAVTDPRAGFTDKVALVTGASGGIGAAVARALAGRGCRRLALHYHSDVSGIQKVVAECCALGADNIQTLQCDLADASGRGAAALVERTVAHFGDLHIIVNNAGIYREIDIGELNYSGHASFALGAFMDNWAATQAANVTGHAALTFAAGRHFMHRQKVVAAATVAAAASLGGPASVAAAGDEGSDAPASSRGGSRSRRRRPGTAASNSTPLPQASAAARASNVPATAEADPTAASPPPVVAIGAIVNVGSRGALRGEPSAWSYAASKAALHALAQSAAARLGRHGVSVTAVAPGFVATPMAAGALSGAGGAAIASQSPWGRVATPEEVAEAVLFLAAYWACPWVSGSVLDCNGASYLH